MTKLSFPIVPSLSRRRRARRSRAQRAAIAALLATVFAHNAHAEPLRLRGDALAQTRSPVGLLVLQGSDRFKPWIDAETVSWLGVSDQPGVIGDVLTLSVRLRERKTGSELRLGRMLVSTGAVRPLHLDGARGVLRLRTGTAFEAFAGSLVARGFDYQGFAWASGGRVAQSIGDRFTIGASYMQQREDAQLARHEAGLDAAFNPAPWFSAALRSSFDLVHYGLADALLSASVQNASSRLELFVTHRSPGRLLPATSLFSVLGDFAATSVGMSGRKRLFPRLEIIASGSGQAQSDRIGGQGLLRTALALDDDWAGQLGLELRRVHVGEARWSGARATLQLPLSQRLRAATELELVVPDQPNGRGALWPWALLGLGYRLPSGWDFSAGIEASSGRSYRAEAHALARVSYMFDTGASSR